MKCQDYSSVFDLENGEVEVPRKGFGIIELLVCVVVILIICNMLNKETKKCQGLNDFDKNLFGQNLYIKA